jgi:hypothetical protein
MFEFFRDDGGDDGDIVVVLRGEAPRQFAQGRRSQGTRRGLLQIKSFPVVYALFAPPA